MLKILFMGTPAFSIPSLRGLLEAGHEVISVYTRPDRPRGRGLRPSPSPVKQFALDNGLPVHHPERLRDRREWYRVRKFDPDFPREGKPSIFLYLGNLEATRIDF